MTRRLRARAMGPTTVGVSRITGAILIVAVVVPEVMANPISTPPEYRPPLGRYADVHLDYPFRQEGHERDDETYEPLPAPIEPPDATSAGSHKAAYPRVLVIGGGIGLSLSLAIGGLWVVSRRGRPVE